MKLKDMTDQEQQALGALVRKMVGLDGEYSPAESAALQRVGTELGEDDFWHLIDEVGHESLGDDELKAKARAVTRQEAQEVIYSVLFNIAASGTVVAPEGFLLDWLADTWGVKSSSVNEEGS